MIFWDKFIYAPKEALGLIKKVEEETREQSKTAFRPFEVSRCKTKDGTLISNAWWINTRYSIKETWPLIRGWCKKNW